MNVTKAIVAVGGLGARRLPITKSIDKCMLPLVNRPIVDYVVEDLVRAGITDIYFVISGGSTQLRHFYSRDTNLEAYLTRGGNEHMIPLITPPADVTFHYIEQDLSDPRYGTTVPVWLSRDHIVGDDPVLIVMGDQCLYREDGGSEAADLIAAVTASGTDGGLIGVPVPMDQVSNYGIIESDDAGTFVRIVEKPTPEEAPSDLNNASIYLVPSEFLHSYIEADMQRPHSGEYMITDPINAFVADGKKLQVVAAKGTYLDCGTAAGWVSANQYMIDRMQTR